MTTIDPKIASAIRSRLNDIREWMADEAPYLSADQRHLDANTPERAYWHFGYQAALQDILNLAEECSEPEHRSGHISNECSPAAPDVPCCPTDSSNAKDNIPFNAVFGDPK